METVTTTHYDLLGVSRDATAEEIKRAYRAAARIHHPDAGGDADTFKAIGEAHQVLSDPVARAAYNLSLDRPAPSGHDPDDTFADADDGWSAAEPDVADAWEDVTDEGWDDVDEGIVDDGPQPGPQPQAPPAWWDTDGSAATTIGRPGPLTDQIAHAPLSGYAFVLNDVRTPGRTTLDHVIVDGGNIMVVHHLDLPDGTYTVAADGKARRDGRRHRAADTTTLTADTKALLADLKLDAAHWHLTVLLAVAGDNVDLAGYTPGYWGVAPAAQTTAAIAAWSAGIASGPVHPAVLADLHSRARRTKDVTHHQPARPRVTSDQLKGLGTDRWRDMATMATTRASLLVLFLVLAAAWLPAYASADSILVELPVLWVAALPAAGLAWLAEAAATRRQRHDTEPSPAAISAAGLRAGPTGLAAQITIAGALVAATAGLRTLIDVFPFADRILDIPLLALVARLAVIAAIAVVMMAFNGTRRIPAAKGAARWRQVLTAPDHRWPLVANALRWTSGTDEPTELRRRLTADGHKDFASSLI